MSVITYKCPNCDAGLAFDPDNGKFVCDFCKSSFEEQVLQDKEKQAAQEGQTRPEESAEQKAQTEQAFGEHSQLYECPNCGAEIIADDTTAATFCVYCHNPVVLAGKIAGSFRPDYLIPFSVDRKRVTDLFNEWCKKKKFMEDDFHSQKQVDNLQGVYYPFWVIDVKANGRLAGTGRKVRTWRSGDYTYTETSVYRVQREGVLDFNDITVTALNKKQINILNGIQPFNMSRLKPFNMSFLSGFLAEKRNIEQEGARVAMEQTVVDGGNALLKGSVGGYSSVSYEDVAITPVNEDWLHVMLPAWMLTYRFRDEDYFFAVNGDTGKVAGRVPVSRKKLAGLFAGVAAGLSALLIFLGWLI
ncbi:TFIIB-type zinc ribbon-containing protein [Christensenellaceae bacterium OttesenSCG-928-K19]|nr:TFIIB-type zinc ribbon-containing protein [Christensenellaceae bacterium OttesenSCG-928-K19]